LIIVYYGEMQTATRPIEGEIGMNLESNQRDIKGKRGVEAKQRLLAETLIVIVDVQQ